MMCPRPFFNNGIRRGIARNAPTVKLKQLALYIGHQHSFYYYAAGFASSAAGLASSGAAATAAGAAGATAAGAGVSSFLGRRLAYRTMYLSRPFTPFLESRRAAVSLAVAPLEIQCSIRSFLMTTSGGFCAGDSGRRVPRRRLSPGALFRPPRYGRWEGFLGRCVGDG